MKVVFHERYKEVYSDDPAARAGRIESIYSELFGRFEFIEPVPADEEDLRLVHTQSHVGSIKKRKLYDVALLAVGGAIKASELAMEGEPAFGLIRPPGHHASPSSCWGFCFFNNVAISIEKLRKEGKIKKACIVDIDLHYGDGTANIFASKPEVSYYHMPGGSREDQLEKLSDYLAGKKGYEMLAVSAGFDRHEKDWGGVLKTRDYEDIGKTMRDCAERECDGKRYAVLEGGYNHQVLGKNVKALLKGIS
ncbi:MAG: histone deacetylase family protein [Thermoproteota archaeon]|nr:histone deacetylase family protein [Thermoproteota archaeon]